MSALGLQPHVRLESSGDTCPSYNVNLIPLNGLPGPPSQEILLDMLFLRLEISRVTKERSLSELSTVSVFTPLFCTHLASRSQHGSKENNVIGF